MEIGLADCTGETTETASPELVCDIEICTHTHTHSDTHTHAHLHTTITTKPTQILQKNGCYTTENGCYGHSNRFGSVACNFCSRFVSVSVMQAQCMSVVGRVFVLCAHGTDSVVDTLRTSIYHGTRTGHECAFWRLHVH